VAAFPAIQAGYALALVPVTNLALAMREALVGHYPPGILAVTFAATGVHVGLALALGVRLLSSESVLFGAAGAADRRARGRFGPDVLWIFGIALLLLWFLGQRVQAMDLCWGMVFTQVVLVAGLAVGALVWLGLPVGEGLSLRRPRGVDLCLAVVAGLCAPGLSALIAVAQAPLLPVSQRTLEALEQAMTLDAPLPVVVVVFALLPALCEETLFRGTLLSLARRSWGPVVACLAVGALFGLVHLQVMRIAPTGVLGVLLCVAVLRGRSLWLPVLVHGLHNALLVAVAGQAWARNPPVAILVAMAAVAVGAVAGMGSGKPQDRGTPVILPP
jgi:sodium transport system permease protein